jgi:hypothetical protein
MPEPKPGVVEIIRVEPLARHISELTIQAPDEQSRVHVRPAHLQVQAGKGCECTYRYVGILWCRHLVTWRHRDRYYIVTADGEN